MKPPKGHIFLCGLPVQYHKGLNIPPVLTGSGQFWFSFFKMAYEFRVDNLMLEEGQICCSQRGQIYENQPTFYTVMANNSDDAWEVLRQGKPFLTQGEAKGTHQILLINEIEIAKFLLTSPTEFLKQNHMYTYRNHHNWPAFEGVAV